MAIGPDDRLWEPLRLWSLREDVLVDAEDGRLLVETEWGLLHLADPGRKARDALSRMRLGPVSLANALDGAGDTDRARFAETLGCLAHCVVHSLAHETGTGPLLSAVPISREARFQLPVVTGGDLVRLSRFTQMRAEGGELVLESPLSRHRVVAHRPSVAWVAGTIAHPAQVDELAPSLGVSPRMVTAIVAYLVAAGMAVLGPDPFDEDQDRSLRRWSRADLMFHVGSRIGRRLGPVGATFPGADLPPEPAVKPPPAGTRFPLARPGPGAASLDGALDSGRSFRDFSDEPITAAQLGELLFRSARVRSRSRVPSCAGEYEVSDRPYPSIGGLYELELYLTLDRPAGLPRGSYHYDPIEHSLTLLDTANQPIAAMLDDAKAAAGATRRPPALVTITARIGRLSWVYSGIGYATALKHVGMLQQTLWLVATSMGLAPCPLAIGDSEIANRALRLNWPAEVSVGEFVVGNRPAD